MFKFLIQHKCSLMFHVFKFIALCVNLVVKFLRHILAISIIFNMSILLQIKASISLFSPDKGFCMVANTVLVIHKYLIQFLHMNIQQCLIVQ